MDTATWSMYSACMVAHFEHSHVYIMHVNRTLAFQNDVTSHATNYIPKRESVTDISTNIYTTPN